MCQRAAWKQHKKSCVPRNEDEAKVKAAEDTSQVTQLSATAAELIRTASSQSDVRNAIKLLDEAHAVAQRSNPSILLQRARAALRLQSNRAAWRRSTSLAGYDVALLDASEAILLLSSRDGEVAAANIAHELRARALVGLGRLPEAVHAFQRSDARDQLAALEEQLTQQRLRVSRACVAENIASAMATCAKADR
mgnify:FL=1